MIQESEKREYRLIIWAYISYILFSIMINTINTNKNKIEYTTIPPQYLETVDIFLKYAEINTSESDYKTILRRYNSLDSIIYRKAEYMPYSNGKPVLGYVEYKLIDGEVLPSVICFSDKLDFEYYGMVSIVFHELGHALLLLDDVGKNGEVYNDQIMWYSGIASYYKYSINGFLNEQVKIMFKQGESKELIESITNDIKVNGYSIDMMEQ